MLGSGVPYPATLMRLDVAPSIVPPAVLSILPSILRSSALNRALGVLGDGWTLLVLREAFLGVSAFERLRERLAIPRQTLANRLRALVADDILELRGREYKLTAKGLDLYPHSLLMWRWERHWGGASAPALPSRLMHRPCGAATIPTLACRHCAAPVQLCDVAYRPGAIGQAVQRLD